MLQNILRWLSNVSVLRSGAMVMVGLLVLLTVQPVFAEETSRTADGAQILQEFNSQHTNTVRDNAIPEKEKRQIMFLIGVVLFIFVLITGALGLAMGMYGKQVFVAHMLFAGLSVSLAIVHAIVGVVWFYPF